MWIKIIYEGCLDLLFPPRCGVCQIYLEAGDRKTICPDCLSRVRSLQEPVCLSCGIEVYNAGTGQPLCGECLRNPPSF